MRELLSAGFDNCTVKLYPTKKELSHARYMILYLSSGKVINLRLDQGLGYWKLNETINFPFDETVETQQKWIERKIDDLSIVNNKDYHTYIFKSEGAAETAS